MNSKIFIRLLFVFFICVCLPHHAWSESIKESGKIELLGAIEDYKFGDFDVAIFQYSKSSMFQTLKIFEY